jgi:hypothetical protein
MTPSNDVVQIKDHLRARQPSPWFVLEGMRKSLTGPRTWVALLIDVEPEEHSGGGRPVTKSQTLDLGTHKSRDSTWAFAEQRLASRH